MKISDQNRSSGEEEKPLTWLQQCNVCPRHCGVNRLNDHKGFCGTDANLNISSVCIHRGEEPPISGVHGIVNIFFAHCNLQCIYCQNYQISDNRGAITRNWSLDEVVQGVIDLLDKGCHAVGFVSPSHMVPQVMMIIDALRDAGRNPVFVYNSNGYDSVTSLKHLEGYIDVYLPDFKYMDGDLAFQLSGAADYPEVVLPALHEMIRQVGRRLLLNEAGEALRGVIIRHLVLPGAEENSKTVLRTIARELSPDMFLSVMSQYYPAGKAVQHPVLCRTITQKEYDQVVALMEELEMANGWLQDLDSEESYRPDFDESHPFE